MMGPGHKSSFKSSRLPLRICLALTGSVKAGHIFLERRQTSALISQAHLNSRRQQALPIFISFHRTLLMASSQSLIFEERVYLAFKDIFNKGQRAQLRKAKTVLPIIIKYQNHDPVSSLLKAVNQQAVCEVLCRLLKEEVFQNEEKASRRFANDLRTVLPPALVVSEPPALELTFLQAPNSEAEASSKLIQGVVPESDPDSTEEYGGK